MPFWHGLVLRPICTLKHEPMNVATPAIQRSGVRPMPPGRPDLAPPRCAAQAAALLAANKLHSEGKPPPHASVWRCAPHTGTGATPKRAHIAANPEGPHLARSCALLPAHSLASSAHLVSAPSLELGLPPAFLLVRVAQVAELTGKTVGAALNCVEEHAWLAPPARVAHRANARHLCGSWCGMLWWSKYGLGDAATSAHATGQQNLAPSGALATAGASPDIPRSSEARGVDGAACVDQLATAGVGCEGGLTNPAREMTQAGGMAALLGDTSGVLSAAGLSLGNRVSASSNSWKRPWKRPMWAEGQVWTSRSWYRPAKDGDNSSHASMKVLRMHMGAGYASGNFGHNWTLGLREVRSAGSATGAGV
eukprot:CAMPEP_0175371126 /NCGR_PEP_ID=MMETSP0095-20121207/21560_1 /TAXON_ID=311494 /ORGANISM="Alexandrium monilatum, Strain CCMP3105" /LENGTH=364 /DNA_ID=CAMNT_0016669291 /DNA_START=54 /DNA_END=1148 /DNA_ORIENTATION=-